MTEMPRLRLPNPRLPPTLLLCAFHALQRFLPHVLVAQCFCRRLSAMPLDAPSGTTQPERVYPGAPMWHSHFGSNRSRDAVFSAPTWCKVCLVQGSIGLPGPNPPHEILSFRKGYRNCGIGCLPHISRPNPPWGDSCPGTQHLSASCGPLTLCRMHRSDRRQSGSKQRTGYTANFRESYTKP